MGCGNSKSINSADLTLSQPKNGLQNKRKSIGIQTSETNLLDQIQQEADIQARQKFVKDDPNLMNSKSIRRGTNGPDQQLSISGQGASQIRKSSISQEQELPFEMQLKLKSECNIEIQNSTPFALLNSCNKDQLYSPSIANQTANFFKSGEQDAFSSRDYLNSSAIPNNLILNNLSHLTSSQNILPDSFLQNSLGIQGLRQFTERQQNKLPTLSNPISFHQNGQDYVLVMQHSEDSGNGNSKNLNDVHKEGILQTLNRKLKKHQSSIILDEQEFKKSIFSSKIPQSEQKSDIENNHMNSQNQSVLNEIQTSTTNSPQVNMNKMEEKQILFSTKDAGADSKSQSTQRFEEQSKQKTLSMRKNSEFSDKEDISIDKQNLSQKSKGSFIIKKRPSLKSISVHEPQQIQNSYDNISSALSHQEKQNWIGKETLRIIDSPGILNIQQGAQNGGALPAAQKKSINLIDLVKNQQFLQQQQTNIRQSSQNCLRSPGLNSTKGQVGTLMLRSIRDELGPSATFKQVPKKFSKSSQQQKLLSQKSNSQGGVLKSISPKTNLIELVQSMSNKKFYHTNSSSSHNVFALHSTQNEYDQQLDIDGLSPISTNVNPNFICASNEYDYEEYDENYRFMPEKSNTHIPSFTNIQNNSSYYSEQKDTISQSCDGSQMYPLFVQGSALEDMSVNDFENYELDIQAQDALRASTNCPSMRILNSQILQSYRNQQPSSQNIANSNLFHYHKMQSSQSGFNGLASQRSLAQKKSTRQLQVNDEHHIQPTFKRVESEEDSSPKESENIKNYHLPSDKLDQQKHKMQNPPSNKKIESKEASNGTPHNQIQSREGFYDLQKEGKERTPSNNLSPPDRKISNQKNSKNQMEAKSILNKSRSNSSNNTPKKTTETLVNKLNSASKQNPSSIVFQQEMAKQPPSNFNEISTNILNQPKRQSVDQKDVREQDGNKLQQINVSNNFPQISSRINLIELSKQLQYQEQSRVQINNSSQPNSLPQENNLHQREVEKIATNNVENNQIQLKSLTNLSKEASEQNTNNNKATKIEQSSSTKLDQVAQNSAIQQSSSYGIQSVSPPSHPIQQKENQKTSTKVTNGIQGSDKGNNNPPVTFTKGKNLLEMFKETSKNIDLQDTKNQNESQTTLPTTIAFSTTTNLKNNQSKSISALNIAKFEGQSLLFPSIPSVSGLDSSHLQINPTPSLVLSSSNKASDTDQPNRKSSNNDKKDKEKKQNHIEKKAENIESHLNTELDAPQRQKGMYKSLIMQPRNDKLSNNLSVVSPQSKQIPSSLTKSVRLSKANTTTLSKNASFCILQDKHSVRETSYLDKSVNAEGQKQINNYVILKIIGQGMFGKVKQVLDTQSKQYFAVKVINRDKLKKRKLDRTKNAFSLIEKEVAILKRMAHPNIVKLYEVIDDQDEAKIYLVMDLLKKGSINSKQYWKVEKGKEYSESQKYKISEEKLKKYFRDFLLGLDYLHNFANVVHRDIKPDNLLVGNDDDLKIGDFGVSQMFEGGKDEFTNDNGTKCYLAPEIFKTHEFNGRPLDIWAAGVCFFELGTGERPFQGKVLEELKKNILEKELTFPPDVSEDLKAMLQKCLNKDPKLRATVTDLFNDDWVTDKGENPLEFEVREGDLNDVNDEDIKNAFTKSFLNQRVNITAKLKANLNKTRSNIEKMKSFVNEEDNTRNVNK